MSHQLPPTVVAQQADALGNLYQIVETQRGETVINKFRPARTVSLSEYQHTVGADDLSEVTDHIQAGGFTPLDDDRQSDP